VLSVTNDRLALKYSFWLWVTRSKWKAYWRTIFW
jgi:hypothetical protein